MHILLGVLCMAKLRCSGVRIRVSLLRRHPNLLPSSPCSLSAHYSHSNHARLHAALVRCAAPTGNKRLAARAACGAKIDRLGSQCVSMKHEREACGTSGAQGGSKRCTGHPAGSTEQTSRKATSRKATSLRDRGTGRGAHAPLFGRPGQRLGAAGSAVSFALRPGQAPRLRAASPARAPRAAPSG